MSSSNHTTRECSVHQIHPELYQAIREYFQAHALGDPESETIMCCETIPRQRTADTFFSRLAAFLEGNSETTKYLAILITAEWLVWARGGDQPGAIVTGARLYGLNVKAYSSIRSKDMGLELTGFINSSKKLARGSLTMGPELAAQKFCDEVGQAILKINPPVKRGRFPKWMGG
jgi:hypothetical protein